MKNILFIVLINLSFGQYTMAQNNQRTEKLEARKIAYISNAVDLTPVEAKVFWPVYNEHHKKVKQIKKTYKSDKKLSVMSDNELEKWIDNFLIKESKLLDEKKTFVAQLKAIIPIRKIAILYKTEKKFRHKILKEVKKRMKKKRKVKK